MAPFSCTTPLLLFPALLLSLLLYSSPFHQNYFTTLFIFPTSCSYTKTNQDNPQGSLSTSILIKKKYSLERIEEDLARARAEIHKAIHSRTYKSNKEGIFIPRGSIYRNSFAFHQSHIEMVKRFKVWIYKEGDRPLVHDGPLKDIYAIEGQFISEMESGMSPFIASHPEEAHAYFIPISVANIVDYVYKTPLNVSTYSRDQLQMLVEDYINIIRQKYPFWNRSNGADHFMVSCHDWAPDVSNANPELFKNFIRVICNSNTTEGFRPERDVAMPEVYGPADDLTPPNLGQAPNNRPILAFFAGGVHGDIRKVLIDYWKGKDNEIIVHEYLPKGQNYSKLMGRSKFCLCPSGFEVASARVVESIYAGCVPVIICDHYFLPFSDVLDWSRFSISISVDKIPEIKNILRQMSNYKYLKMQKRVRRLQRHFKVNRPAQPYDVIHMVLHSVWLRRLNIRITT